MERRDGRNRVRVENANREVLTSRPLKSYDRKGRSLQKKAPLCRDCSTLGVCIRKQDPRSLDDFFSGEVCLMLPASPRENPRGS